MRAFLVLVAFALLGCSKPAPAPAEQQPAAPAQAGSPPAAKAARPVSVEENGEALDFAYAWPAEAAAIPALDRRFREDMAKAKTEALGNARADMAMAKQDGREFHAHEFSRNWSRAGQSARLLSLASKTDFFTGGAHPNHGVDSLLWDRSAGREIGTADLFEPPTRFAELVSFRFCQALDAERARRRGGEQLEGEFAACPSLSDLAIVPTDGDGNGRFEAIRLVAAPYVAGPYAEGEYDVPLSVTAELIAAMKPEFRQSFELQRQ
jgi:hypothetical protein